MKILKSFITASALFLYGAPTFAGLDWTYGSLTNADNIYRSTSSVAYSSNGNVFVAGVEETASGNKIIVTKKFSANGILLASVSNTYFVPVGTVYSDWVKSISLDVSGNVYVLGAQFANAARGEDVVLIKYNSSLVLQWKSLIYNSAYPNNNFNDIPAKLLFDGSGNIYATGILVNEAIPDQTTIFVRKYNSSGSVIYTAHVGEPSGTKVSNASDVCMDGNDNVTVTAKAQSVLFGTRSIMYARVSSSGIMSWQKFYFPPANYELAIEPEIECTSSGTLYLASAITRDIPSSNYFSRHMTVKLNSAGTKIWEVLTPELNQGANGFTLQTDANENIYPGGDFVEAHGTPFSNYRIYKLNSSGTLLWTYTSPEISIELKICKYATSALFVASQVGSGGNIKLRKLNAQNGSVLWTENIVSTTPPGYLQSSLNSFQIDVNKLTSEVAISATLLGDVALPSSATEYRWHVRNYGATSPRLSSADITFQNTNKNLAVQVFPNPSTDVINVLLPDNFIKGRIRVVDINEKLIKEDVIGGSTARHSIPVGDLHNGIYFVQITSEGLTETQKIIVQH